MHIQKYVKACIFFLQLRIGITNPIILKNLCLHTGFLITIIRIYYIWIHGRFLRFFFSFYYYFGILYLQKLFTDYLCLSHTNLHNVCNIIYIRCICYIWFWNHHTLKLYITLKKYASRIILCINVISIPNLYIYIERGSKKCRRKCLYVYKYYIPTEKLFCVVEILK